MVWQRAGTVSVQTGSTTVVGASVDFAASSRVGDSFIGPDGVNYEVANVASATVISILPAYKGPTISGAAYAIMPVQGYDKMLSDAFNGLNNQFGPKLAALGTTGNYEVLPVDKGGTGNTTGTAAKLASSAVVGVVSQSGGQATGAILETGSNANGTYIKYADGTLIAWKTVPTTTGSNIATGALWKSAVQNAGSLPAAFVGTPAVLCDGTDGAGGGWVAQELFGSATTWGAFSTRNSFQNNAAGSLYLLAVGRWF